MNITPKEFGFSSVHIIDSYQTKGHVDAMNCPPAITFTVGDFSGGEYGTQVFGKGPPRIKTVCTRGALIWNPKSKFDFPRASLGVEGPL